MASYEFKCRRCNKVVSNKHVPDHTALVHLLNAIRDKPPTLKMAPRMLSIHACKDGGVGVSDLIGYSVDKPKKEE